MRDHMPPVQLACLLTAPVTHAGTLLLCFPQYLGNLRLSTLLCLFAVANSPTDIACSYSPWYIEVQLLSVGNLHLVLCGEGACSWKLIVLYQYRPRLLVYVIHHQINSYVTIISSAHPAVAIDDPRVPGACHHFLVDMCPRGLPGRQGSSLGLCQASDPS